MVFVTVFGKRWVNGRWIGTVGDEWVFTSHPGVKWWESMPYESVDLLVHSSLGNVWLLVVLMLI